MALSGLLSLSSATHKIPHQVFLLNLWECLYLLSFWCHSWQSVTTQSPVSIDRHFFCWVPGTLLCPCGKDEERGSMETHQTVHTLFRCLGSAVGNEGEAVSGQKEMINKHLRLRQAAAGRAGPGAEDKGIWQETVGHISRLKGWVKK